MAELGRCSEEWESKTAGVWCGVFIEDAEEASLSSRGVAKMLMELCRWIAEEVKKKKFSEELLLG